MAKRRPAGDGMVRKREDGRWEGRIVIGHKETASRCSVMSTPRRKKLCWTSCTRTLSATAMWN